MPRRSFEKMFRKWTGQALNVEDSVAAAGTEGFVIVAPSDYEGGTVSGNVEAGSATLLRIRGSVNMRATVVGGLAYMYVICHGNDESVFSAATSSLVITSGDILWQDVYMVGTVNPVHVEVDIPVKRRLENDKVEWIISAVAQTIVYNAQFRALIRSSG